MLRFETQSSDPVITDVETLLQRVRISISMVEAAMNSVGPDDLDNQFFVLDDVSPRCHRLRIILGAVDATLQCALQDG